MVYKINSRNRNWKESNLKLKKLLTLSCGQVDQYMFASGAVVEAPISSMVSLHGPMSIARVSNSIDVLSYNKSFVYHRIHDLLKSFQTCTIAGRPAFCDSCIAELHHCHRLVLSVSALWTELATSQDCRRQTVISKLFCPVLKCGVNRILSCLYPVSNLTKDLFAHRRRDWTKLFSLQYIKNHWKQSESTETVANFIHTIDKRRQSCLVRVGGVNKV